MCPVYIIQKKPKLDREKLRRSSEEGGTELCHKEAALFWKGRLTSVL